MPQLNLSSQLRSWLLLCAFAVSGVASAAHTVLYRTDQRGNYVMVGNTLGQDCGAGVAPVVGTVGACGTSTSDTGIDVLWRSDSPAEAQAEANTSVTPAQARSTAVLAIPAGASVTYARLYWSAEHSLAGTADTTVTLGRTNAFSVPVTASKSATLTRTGQYFYQASADVTAVVQQYGNGAYRLSDIEIRDIRNVSSEVSYVGWSLVVFYSLPSDPPRNLVLFDGFELVDTNANITVALNGFLVPNSGKQGSLAVVAYEGDNGITGDSLSFRRVPTSGAAPAFTAMSGGANPANNFFNATRSVNGTATFNAGDLPQLSGAGGSVTGLDMDSVDVTSLVSAGDTQAEIRVATGSDVLWVGPVVTAMTTLKPSFTNTLKSVVDLNGGAVRAGDELEYTIATSNDGSDVATGVVLSDPLPAGVTFKPGSLEVVAGANAGAKTDAAGDDQAEYVSATRTVVFRVGTGANSTAGGNIGIAEAATQVRFRVVVNADTLGVVANQASVSANGVVGLAQGQPTMTFLSGTQGFIAQPTTVNVQPVAVPVITGPSSGGFVPSTQPTITGSAANDVVSVTLTVTGPGGTSTVVTVPVVNGGWSWTPPAGLPDGTYTVVASGSDAQGAGSSSTPSTGFTIDTQAPVLTLQSPSTTSQPSPVITGTADPGSTVTVIIDGTPSGTATADGNGNWTYTPPAPLPEGNHTISVSQTDSAGNTGSTNGSVTVDQQPPETTFTQTPDATKPTANSSFEFGSSEPGSTFECRVDGGAWAACESPTTIPNLGNGHHVIEVRATDAAGNVDPTPAVFEWDVERTVTIAVPGSGSGSGSSGGSGEGGGSGSGSGDGSGSGEGVSGGGSGTFTGVAPPGSKVDIYIDGELAGSTIAGEDGSWSFTPPSPLSSGEHTVEVRVDVLSTGEVTFIVPPHGFFAGGGFGCSSTGEATPTAALAAVLLLGVWAQRRRFLRRRSALAVVALCASATTALAQSSVPDFQLERLRLNPSGAGGLVVSSGEVLPQSEFRLSLAGHYERNPLVYVEDGQVRGAAVRNRFTAHLFGAWSILDWLQVGAEVPLIAHQNGDDLQAQGVSAVRSFAFGSPTVTVTAAGLSQSRRDDVVDLAFQLAVGLPFASSDSFAKDRYGTYIPSVSVGHRFGWLRVGGQVGGVIRPKAVLSPNLETAVDEIGSEVNVGAVVATVGHRLRWELSSRAAIPLSRIPLSVETLLGARYSAGPVELFALGGPSFGQAPGAPMYRVLVGASFVGAPTRVVCEHGVPHNPALCPAFDSDQDGIVNRADACPLEPEDRDGFKDEDGCPDLDNDGDSTPDVTDACPTVAGPFPNRGCPVMDDDGDGIGNDADKCPDVKGIAALQGCAPAATPLVSVSAQKLEIKEKIYFAFGRATLLSQSFEILDQIATVLRQNPTLPTVTIEGHTDGKGNAAKNKKLSQDRADSVRKYLLDKGVEPFRLRAVGYGADRKVMSDDTPEGREANRRVEFTFDGK